MTVPQALVIRKADLGTWVDSLIGRTEVIGPTRGPRGDVLLATLSGARELLWDFTNALQPPKQFLLPQTEPLVQIRTARGHAQAESVADAHPQVLFNVRSCDVKGFAVLRRMHAQPPGDTAYLRRDEQTTLVCLTCPTPCPLGFCVCADAGPFLEEHFDLQLTAMDDAMFVEVGSAKGRALLEGQDRLFRPAAASEVARRAEIEAEARRRFGPVTCHFGSAMRRVSTGRVAQALWDAIADWCLECGGCNFICPTCYCFSVRDRREDGSWERCRVWDSCQYAAFTLEASGHNPRKRQGGRVRRRFFHKVSAQYYQKDGDVGCVGCGRCITVCLGTADMPAVVEALRKGEWHG
jgi:sulfhydrogenase subunit beta (sulfur reductase)